MKMSFHTLEAATNTSSGRISNKTLIAIVVPIVAGVALVIAGFLIWMRCFRNQPAQIGISRYRTGDKARRWFGTRLPCKEMSTAEKAELPFGHRHLAGLRTWEKPTKPVQPLLPIHISKPYTSYWYQPSPRLITTVKLWHDR